jgi:hypothetical protein
MTTSIYPDGVNWTGPAYASAALADVSVANDPEHRLWRNWFDVLSGAKGGEFSGVPSLVESHRATGNWILRSMCADLLGDAGTPDSFAAVTAAMSTADDDIVAKIEFADALAWWGRLSIIPIVLQTYLSVRHFNDADILPVRLSDLLEPEAGPISTPSDFETPEAYADFVMGRHAELRQRFGSDEVIVFMGQRFGVVHLAGNILAALSDGTFDYPLRRKFEASTGIDCQGFYDDDGNLQSLAAAAIVEEFLESNARAEYEDGVRYFFGHRLPD